MNVVLRQWMLCVGKESPVLVLYSRLSYNFKKVQQYSCDIYLTAEVYKYVCVCVNEGLCV